MPARRNRANAPTSAGDPADAIANSNPKPNVTANSTPRANPSTLRPRARWPRPGKINERITASRGSTRGASVAVRITCANGVPQTPQMSRAIGFSAPHTEHGQNGSRLGADRVTDGGSVLSETGAGGGSGSVFGGDRRDEKH